MINLTCCKITDHPWQKVLLLYKQHRDHFDRMYTQVPGWIYICDNMKAVHKHQFQQAWIEPEEPKLGCAIIKRISSPTNHINDVVSLIHLHDIRTFTNQDKTRPTKWHKKYEKLTSWNIQSRIEYVWPDPEAFLFLDPLGRAEGKRCSIDPFRSLLIVAPLEETTKHRFPEGLANTNLQNPKCRTSLSASINQIKFTERLRFSFSFSFSFSEYLLTSE